MNNRINAPVIIISGKGCRISRWGKPFQLVHLCFQRWNSKNLALGYSKHFSTSLIYSHMIHPLEQAGTSVWREVLRLVTMGHFETWTLIFIAKSLWASLLLLNLDIHTCLNVTKHTWEYLKTGSDKIIYWIFQSGFYHVKQKARKVVYWTFD